ncbi:MAG: GIY-YIG nuclease family protein [Phocaeicola sp.]
MKRPRVAFVLSKLEERGVISPTRSFPITIDLLDTYMKVYAKLGNAKLGGPKKANRPTNLSLARKIAALNLVEYKKQHKLDTEEGFVYIISNPAWPDLVKVGMSVAPEKRLATYQTYSPKRDYKLEWFGFFFNRRDGEKVLASMFPQYSHEWVYADADTMGKLRSKTSVG